MKRVLVLLQVLLLAALAPAANAQVLYGSIVGNVTDASAAGIPSAQVKVVNTGTGQQWDLTAGAEGTYAINTLPPGAYSVTIMATGFKSASRRDVNIAANSTVRVNVELEVGQVSESVEISAQAAILKTDTMDVRSEIAASDLQNVPVPVTRNFQNLLVAVPGMAPPVNAHSISANPSRSLQVNANGTTAQSTALRIDGATAWNSWLPHVGGYVPSLEAIQAVNIQSSAYEAELGYAGGAAVNVTIKSGTNDIHGSAFEYHNNQHLKARPYFLPANRGKDKRILNQFGGTVGGPIIRNKLFYFGSYEGTLDRQSSFRTVNVPTTAMKTGNMSASSLPIFDPLTGAANGSGRTPFAGNIVPAARISPIVKKIVDLTPNPNLGDFLGTNYFVNGSFIYDRHVFDTKFNAQATDKLNLSARVSYLDWSFTNPPVFGQLGGRGIEDRGSYDGEGLGKTITMTYSAVYTLSPTLVLDGYVGYTKIDNNVENIRLDEKLGLEFLGIPGTNGPNRYYGGWPQFNVASFEVYGRNQTNSPFSLGLPQAQYVSSLAWVKGKHNLRFGWDALWVGMDGNEPRGFPGGFTFNREVTGTVGTAVNDYNSYASFLLGLPNNMERRTRVVTGYTRTWAHALYVRDKWEVTKRLTLSLGLRWDYFGVPTRIDGQGLEIFDFSNGQLKMCGVGQQPTNCGFTMEKKYFAPRLGVAFRPMDTMVIRAGYGISWDPVNIGRNPLQTYPMVSIDNFPAPNNYQPYQELSRGLPAVAAPDLGNGIVTPPRTVSLELADPNFQRSYIQAFNFMIEKDLGNNWVAEAGYVGNRQVNLQNRWNSNYGFIGGGTASRVLNTARTGNRTADTNFHSNTGGFRSQYDSLQSTLQRRFTAGYMLRFTYTWSKATGPRGNENGVDGYANNTPDYFPLIAKVVRQFDRTHNFNMAASAELPFGKGKQYATDGIGAMLLGGWQVNSLLTMYTGAPFTVTSSAGSLNAPGNSQTADQIKPDVEIVGRRDRWFDTTAYAPVTAARFGTSGWEQLRGPGLINLDLSIYRTFKVTERFNLQFRAESFNVSNTPHFANPRNDISAAQPGVITGVANTGREGIDERLYRFALRLSF